MNYSKIRPFLIVILVVGVAYNLFFYLEDSKLEKAKPQSFRITEQYCREIKNSAIYIVHRNKKYSIRMTNGDCPKYPVGSEISLVYNEKYDYFYKQDGLKTATYKLLFFPFLLLLSIIPWNRFSNRKNN